MLQFLAPERTVLDGWGWLTATKNTIPNIHRVSSCDIYRQSVNDALSRQTGDKSDKSHSQRARCNRLDAGELFKWPSWRWPREQDPYWLTGMEKSVDKLIDQRKFMQSETMKSTIKLPPRCPDRLSPAGSRAQREQGCGCDMCETCTEGYSNCTYGAINCSIIRRIDL